MAGAGSGRQDAVAEGLAEFSPLQQRLMSGPLRRTLEQGAGRSTRRRQGTARQRQVSVSGCPVDRGTNIRVNRDRLHSRCGLWRHRAPALAGRRRHLGRLGLAGEGATALDKQYMTVDNHRSPYQDRVYVTWTRFDADGTAYIFGACSRDCGESFSSPKLVSKTSPLCSHAAGVPTPQGTCTVNQFSQPFTGPDGALYVVWDNYDLTGPEPDPGADPADNRAQVLLAKSTDGGNSFSAPVRISDFYDLPDCDTYQGAGAGSARVPEKGETQNSFFCAANWAGNPRDPSEVVVSFASYINITTGSMPPPTQLDGGFYGDYSGLSAVANDQNVYTRSLSIPLP